MAFFYLSIVNAGASNLISELGLGLGFGIKIAKIRNWLRVKIAVFKLRIMLIWKLCHFKHHFIYFFAANSLYVTVCLTKFLVIFLGYVNTVCSGLFVGNGATCGSTSSCSSCCQRYTRYGWSPGTFGMNYG